MYTQQMISLEIHSWNTKDIPEDFVMIKVKLSKHVSLICVFVNSKGN